MNNGCLTKWDIVSWTPQSCVLAFITSDNTKWQRGGDGRRQKTYVILLESSRRIGTVWFNGVEICTLHAVQASWIINKTLVDKMVNVIMVLAKQNTV